MESTCRELQNLGILNHRQPFNGPVLIWSLRETSMVQAMEDLGTPFLIFWDFPRGSCACKPAERCKFKTTSNPV